MASSYTIGVLKEIKRGELRVALTPYAVKVLRALGHEVLVEKGAGLGSGFSDADYQISAGAELSSMPEYIVNRADMIMKVKEFLPSEYPLLESVEQKTLFYFPHLAGADREQTAILLRKRHIAVAYEMVRCNGTFPILAPMSVIAGREGYRQAFAHHAARGHAPMQCAIYGVGVAGESALREALLGRVHVVLIDRDESRLIDVATRIEEEFPQARGRVSCITAQHQKGEKEKRLIAQSDIVISSVMVAGAEAPLVLSDEDARTFSKGAVFIDIAIDQGGSMAWTKGRPTNPKEMRQVDDWYVSATPNIPGSTSPEVAREATEALCQATLSRAELIAAVASRFSRKERWRWPHFLPTEDLGVLSGIQTFSGYLLNRDVESVHGMFGVYRAASEVI